MRVISIGTDQQVLIPGTAAHERMRHYATLVDELRIIVYTPQEGTFPTEPVSIAPHATAQGTHSRSKVHFLFDAYRCARAYIGAASQEWIVTTQDPFEVGFLGYWLHRRVGIPWHAQVHTDFLSDAFVRCSWRHRLQAMIARHFLPHASRVRVVSNRLHDGLVRMCPALQDRIDVLPIFVDTKRMQKKTVENSVRTNLSGYDEVVLVPSRLAPEKRVGDVIDAFRLIAAKHPKTVLLIVGDGTCKKNLMRQAHGLPQVVFVGWTEDMLAYYETAALVVVSSAFEGYGRTLLEAHAAGVPVVTTDVGIAREIVETPGDGRIVPVGDVAALAQGVSDVLIEVRTGMVHPRPLGPQRSLENYLAAYRASWEEAWRSGAATSSDTRV